MINRSVLGFSGESPFSNASQTEPREKTSARDARVSPSHQLPQVDRTKVDPKILEAAEGMEEMFIDYMMRVMRQTVPKNEMDLESPATEIYRSMMDSENSKKAAHAGGIGLSDQIIAYLQGRSYHLPQGHAAPMKEKP
jgi:Rod binding domain-containing protein